MSTIKKIFTIIIFLSVISLTPILKIKALDIPDLPGLSSRIATAVSEGRCNSLVIFLRGSDNRFSYICNSFDMFIPTLDNQYINGSRLLDLRTNFYGINQLRFYRTSNNQYYFAGQVGYYSVSQQQWTSDCYWPNCNYGYNLNGNDNIGYIVAFLKPNNSYDTIYFNSSTDINSRMFWPNYNLQYYESPVDYFTGYTGYFEQPTNLKGSEIDFSGDELSGEYLGLEYSYINTYMYQFNNVDDETTLISHTYTYDNVSLTGNYELGFIVTAKRYNDTPLIVHAITDNTYGCTVTPLKSSYDDINYQYYVNCSSVPFDNISTFKIVVNGSNEYYNLVGPVPFYDTNYLFNNVDNNKYVGISSILRKRTDTPPTPIQPDTPPQDDIIQSITDLNDNIMDPSGPDTSSLSNSAGWLPAGPVDSIINLPITIFNSLINAFSSSSVCSPISLPIPFLNVNITLPCLNTLIHSMGFGSWWEWVGTIASAFYLYKYIVNLYAWVDKTLTFRENNWQDWGGI